MLRRILLSNDPYTSLHAITNLIVDACALLRGQDPRRDEKVELPRTEIEMMVLTVAAESLFRHRKQIGGGPARGLMGMEPATARDTFRWLLRRYSEGKTGEWMRLTDIWLGLRRVPFFIPGVDEVSAHLKRNDAFALALGRLHYRMIPAPFPQTRGEQARYWKQYWNTEGGAGTPEDALKRWEECGCDELMKHAERRAKLV